MLVILFCFVFACSETLEKRSHPVKQENAIVSNSIKSFDPNDWRVLALHQDNRRFPVALLEDKFKKMAATKYAFMRGSLPLYLGHLDAPDSNLKTNFLMSDDAKKLPIFGDAHPENITVYLDPLEPHKDENVSIEFADLDSADYGPWIVDLRRSSMAYRLFYASTIGCGCDEIKTKQNTPCDDALFHLWEGYVSGLKPEQNETKLFWRKSKIIEYRVTQARDEKERKKKLEKQVNLVSGILKKGHTEQENEPILAKKGIFDVSNVEQAMFLISQAQPNQKDIQDTAQIYGKGVSSLPAIRYLFSWREAESSAIKLSEAREVFSPPKYPWSLEEPLRQKYDINRMNTLRKFLWSNERADPNYQLILDTTGTNPSIFKLQSKSEYFKDVDLDKVQEWLEDGDITEQDIVDFGWAIGYVLGSAHGRGIARATSKNGAEIIHEDIEKGGGYSAVWDEIKQTSCVEMRMISEDHDWFVASWREIVKSHP